MILLLLHLTVCPSACAVSGRTPSPPGEGLDESPNSNVHITKELVEACLQADKGQEAKLLSFEEKEMTKKGDNFMCVVTSVGVRYRLGTFEDLRTNYVAKLNPQRAYSDSNKLLKEFFTKESGFYHEIGPALNRELQEIGLPDLRTAKSPFAQLTEGKEVIFMDNLREQGFQMADFRKGLDKNHSLLVVRELARLHGASILLQKKSKYDLLQIYPYLVDGIMTGKDGYERIIASFQDVLKCCAAVARLKEGYDKVAKYIEEELVPKGMEFVREHLQPSAPFVAIVHSDCWSNNILFRNDSDGVPEEARFLDLQLVRQSSPTIDLSFFFFSSLTGQVRRKNMALFLYTYYDTLREVVRAGGLELDFTFEELCEDYERRCLYGIFFGLFATSVGICGSSGGFDFENCSEDCMGEIIRNHKKVLLSLQEYPDIKERFFSIFDDMVEKGFVC